jgi:hypothetical protein
MEFNTYTREIFHFKPRIFLAIICSSNGLIKYANFRSHTFPDTIAAEVATLNDLGSLVSFTEILVIHSGKGRSIVHVTHNQEKRITVFHHYQKKWKKLMMKRGHFH